MAYGMVNDRETRDRAGIKSRSFDEWMLDNKFTNGYNAGYVYGQPTTPGFSGGAVDRNTAIKSWQQEENIGSLSDLLSGSSGSGAGGNPFGAPSMDMSNPYGAAPVASQNNRFETGLSDAESRLRSLLDNPDSINQSAAYKFRVKQGEESINRQLGAKGMLNSGNRLMELTKYGQDMGSQEYDAQAGRLNSLLGTYGQGWLGDKNANTARFNAESGAWLGGERANTDRFAAQSGAWNTAQGNADRNRYQMGMLQVEQNKPYSTGGGSRSSSSTPSYFNPGGITGNTPVDWAAFDKKFADERAALDRY